MGQLQGITQELLGRLHRDPQGGTKIGGSELRHPRRPLTREGQMPSPWRSTSPQCAGTSSAGHGCSRAQVSAKASSSAAAAAEVCRTNRARSITSAGVIPGAVIEVVVMDPF